MPRWLLPAAIVALTLLNGALHLALDVVLFRGNFFGPLGPPPGAPPPAPPPGGAAPLGPIVPLPLPLNQLFVLHFVGSVVLALAFWFAPRWLGARRWWVDAAVVLFTLASIAGWLDLRGPNPLGLGYLSKAIEVVLLLLVAVHLYRSARRSPGDAA